MPSFLWKWSKAWHTDIQSPIGDKAPSFTSSENQYLWFDMSIYFHLTPFYHWAIGGGQESFIYCSGICSECYRVNCISLCAHIHLSCWYPSYVSLPSPVGSETGCVQRHGKPWDNNWVDGGIVALWVFCFKSVWVSPRQPSELVEDKTALRVTLEPQSLVSRKDTHIYIWGERYRKFYMGSAWKKGKRERRDFNPLSCKDRVIYPWSLPL